MTDLARLGAALTFPHVDAAPQVPPAVDGPSVFAQSPAAAEQAPSALAESFAAELDALRRSAVEEGFAAGYAAGTADAEAVVAQHAAAAEAAAQQALAADRARLDSAARSLAAAAHQFTSLSVPALAQVESLISRSAYTLAEAIVGREVALAGNPVGDALARALTVAVPDGPCVLSVHPDDIDLAREASAAIAEVNVVADESVARGGALLAFGTQQVDAQIETALARAKAVLIP